MDANKLVGTVMSLTRRGTLIVSSRQLKREFNALGINWGARHGWPIRKAEDDEMSTAHPRIVKWRIGRGTNGMIGYSLTGDEVAETLADQQGYKRLRN